MASSRRLLAQLLCSALIASGIPGCMSSAAAQEAAAKEGATTATKDAALHLSLLPAPNASGSLALNELPDSPGATLAKQSAQAHTNSAAVSAEPFSAPPQSAQPEQQPSQSSPPSTQQPVGTAVAEASRATGVAASQPAGVAIAPAKQHRARTIVIRVGAILGAGAALGSVVALTEATPSKPPGAH